MIVIPTALMRGNHNPFSGPALLKFRIPLCFRTHFILWQFVLHYFIRNCQHLKSVHVHEHTPIHKLSFVDSLFKGLVPVRAWIKCCLDQIAGLLTFVSSKCILTPTFVSVDSSRIPETIKHVFTVCLLSSCRKVYAERKIHSEKAKNLWSGYVFRALSLTSTLTLCLRISCLCYVWCIFFYSM